MIEVEQPDEGSDVVRARAVLLAVMPELRAHHASLIEPFGAPVAEAVLPDSSSLEDETRVRAFAGTIFGRCGRLPHSRPVA